MKDILHCDLNNFYASVEIRDNPSLADKPIAVCGSVEDRAGIVLAKNYLAKSYGIKTAETIYEAKAKCPNLVIVPPRMDKYVEVSRQVREIYSRYTDLVEPFGMDECWLDITGSHLLFGSSEKIAFDIKETVKRETGLTISVGVSFTKVLAKLGSDMKKPDAITVLSKDNYMDKIKDLAAGEMIGIGPATQSALERWGIFTLGELSKADPDMLSRRIGKAGICIWRAVNGFDDSEVHEIGYSREVKSVGNSTTLRYDLTRNEQVWHVMLSLADQVTERLRRDGLCACGVCISVKTKDLAYREYQMKLDTPLCSPLALAKAGFKLFSQRFDWRLPIRAVGIRGISLISLQDGRQLSMFSDPQGLEKQERLADVSDALRSRFGKKIIYPARMQNELYSAHKKLNVFNHIELLEAQ